MAELLVLITAVIVLLSMLIAYGQSQDALHPLMYLGPMLLFVYVAKPGLLLLRGDLQEFLTRNQIDFAAGLFLVSVSLFCGGVLLGSGGRRGRVSLELTPVLRRRMARLAAVLGVMSLAAYWSGIVLSGGFFQVYSRSKGHYTAGSGWVNELVNLSIPAAALMLLAWQGHRRYRHYLGWAMVFASPLLIHGLLGSRRGPTFMILAAAAVAWYIRRGKRVRLWKVVTTFGLIGALVLLLMAHRREIRLGGNVDFSVAKFWERVVPSEVDTTDDTVFMYGFVNGVNECGRHYWGLRYAATYFVRPIPRQVWPTKYQDLGLGWMVRKTAFAGIAESDWESALGWIPAHGSATGFAGDLFLEFGWLGLAGCLGMGWFYGRLWLQASRRGGMWTLLYVEAAALSIYVPTQSVSAVFHRFLMMSVFAFLLWKLLVGKSHQRRGRDGNGQIVLARQAYETAGASVLK